MKSQGRCYIRCWIKYCKPILRYLLVSKSSSITEYHELDSVNEEGGEGQQNVVEGGSFSISCSGDMQPGV